MRRALLLFSALLAPAGCVHGPSVKDREVAEIHYNLATDALRAGRSQEALKEYDEALKLDDIFADAHMGRGLVLEYAYNKPEEAEREYRRALQLRPGYSDAHNNLGQLLARTGRLPQSLEEFDAALSNMLYKEPHVARCNRAQVLQQMGRKQEALAEFKVCLTLNPRYCQGHRQLGRIHLDEGRTREAIEQFASYARICDKEPDAYYQLGLAHLKAADPEHAREALEKCLSLAPEGELADSCRRTHELLK